MAAVAERPKTTKKSSKPPSDGWWGNGPPPHVRWPGVTIALPAAWVSQRRRWESPDGRYYFDDVEADRACDFFPVYLSHHIGEFAGRAFTLLDYQKHLLTRPIFGWKRASDGLRRFRKIFAFLPKGAGKSPWGAGTGLYLTLCDNEQAAEVYAVAGDTEQARTVHDNSKIMVEESPDLYAMCEVLKNSIYCPASRSTYKVISADAKTKHGFRPHGVLFDEFHAQPNRDLYEALKKSMVKRRQPLMILISHAGDDEEGICYEEYEYAKNVIKGNVDDTCLPIIFEALPDEDWTSPEVWARVNPGHGITVQRDGVAQECQEAINEPRKKHDFLRFHLNRWVNDAIAWIPVDWWDACLTPAPDPAHLRTLQVCAGLDLAQKWDLAAFVLTFREPLEDFTADDVEIIGDDEVGQPVKKTIALNYAVTIVPFFWIPENTMREHEKHDGVPYSLWKERGILTATDGDIIDYTRIYSDIVQKILPRFPRLKQGLIGYDPAFATDIATQLRDRAGLKVHEVLQNFSKLSEPSYILEALIKAKRIKHDGHRVLRTHVENASIKRDDAGRIRPVKPRSASKRIDGIVASIMGIKGLQALPVKKSPYQTRGAYVVTPGVESALPPPPA